MNCYRKEDQDLSRRAVLRGLAGLGAAAAGALPLSLSLPTPAAAAAPGFGLGPRSGMPWHSGCSIGGWQTFEAARGRKLDTITCWCPHKTWTDIASMKGGLSTAVRSGARVSLSVAPLPVTHAIGKFPDSYRLAASGVFDSYYRSAAQRLALSGAVNPIVRIGWEVNHTPRPWYSGADPEGFKLTFRRIATILREHNPTVAIEWNNVRKGGYAGNIIDTYPGDDVVDIIGISYYDGYPAKNSEADWQAAYNRTNDGGPGDLGTWYDFAVSRGKLFAIPEWGIFRNRPDTRDSAFYIEKMHQFFTAAGPNLAYENYFNQKTVHQIVPPDLNPLAAAAYRRLWGAPPATRPR